ncbi:MAG TPA: MFS transporter [Thermoplasmata archaeon]|nr:MFS transporter [Thermoplasmata archaeon]
MTDAEAPLASGAPTNVKAGILSARAEIVVFVGLFLGLLMGSLDNFVVLTALPNIVGDLGQPNGVTFVVSAYLISSTIAVPIFAKLGDILSRRNVFLAGLGIFIAGSALAGQSQNLGELIVFRGIQGFGSGCFFPVGLSIIAVSFEPAMRARVIGALSGVFGIATVAGPFLGSFIVDHTTWRWIFYVNIPIGFVGIAVIASALGALRPSTRASFDYVGAALMSGWVGALTYAFYQISNAGWGWTYVWTLVLFATTAVLLAIFIPFELAHRDPVVPLRLFKNRVIALSGTISILSRAVVFSLFTFLAVFVGVVLYNAGPGSADTIRDMLWFLVIPMVVGALIGGQAITRVAYRPLVASGLALVVIGMFFLTLTNASTPVWAFSYGFLPTGGIVLPLMPMGFGMGLTLGPTTLMAQNEAPRQDVGAATGLVQFLGLLGASVGLSVFSTFQTWRYDAIKPAAPPASCVSSGTPPPSCYPVLAQYHTATVHAIITSYVDLYTVMLGLAVAAFLVALFLRGRMIARGADPTPRPVAVEG